MAFSGFGKNSGPSAPPGAQNPFGNFPRPLPSTPLPISPRSSIGYRDFDASKGVYSSPLDSSQPFPGTHNNEPPLRPVGIGASSFKYDGTQYQRPSTLQPQVAPGNIRTVTPAKTAEFQSFHGANSSYSQPSDQISNMSRRVTESHVDLHSSYKPYSVPYGERSPPPGFQNNLYVGGQHPHREEVHQRPSAPVWVNQWKLSNNNTTPPARGISPVLTTEGTYRSGPMSQNKHANGPLPKRTRSPTLPSNTWVSPENTHSDGHKRSLVQYRDLDAPDDVSSLPLAFENSSSRRESSQPFTGIQKPFPTNTWADQSKSSINNVAPLVQEDMPSALRTRVTYQSGRKPETEHADIQLPKRTRSPTIPSTNEGFTQNPSVVSDIHKRAPAFQSRSLSPISNQANSAEAAANKPMDFPAVKRSKIPFLSSSGVQSQENLDPEQEIERELQQKAKRLARFKDELNPPVESHSTVQNQKDLAKRQHPSMSEKQKVSGDPKIDMMVDSGGGNVYADHEGVASLSSIVGICPDMCPESERAERERKGDLDQYERLDGDRNLSSEFLAVKKYTRTAEREPQLIRPMPILQKTMDYLLNLLDESYDDRFLGLYNFLWDRMRAVRMDLRMQHIFNVEAISMLEQMIRLHIIAMHELCEYTKGEGFSEGFDAHLNIEQMNKTSVELFQLYDDHRKKGKHVPSEREFRGYYALLKLDKHPGYKVEPAELSLDLAKMTPEMRQTPEVLFARHVARACRTGNFIAFFRLARKASYLQACLMHAHFSKLRTQALASLHCGLQMNQGIPITHVAKWLGLEEEDVGELLEYYGFSLKDFEEPYMVKENPFVNVDNDFPVKRSKLVERKRSRMIVNDVSYPSLTESYAGNEVMEILLRKDPEPGPMPLQSIVPTSTPPPCDEEMHDPGTSLSPKGSMQKPMHKTSIFPTTPDKRTAGLEVQVASPGPLLSDFFNNSSGRHQSGIESSKKLNHEPLFRNSFGRLTKNDLATPPVTQETAVAQMRAEEKREPVLPLDYVDHTPSPQPMFSADLGGEELIGIVEEDMPDEATTSNYDREVLEAKLRLILRIWKRRTTKKRILREHKQFTANAALNLLSLGPPMWQFEVPSVNFGTFNIDHVMGQRHEVQERSYSVLNPSDVIAAELVKKNPDAKCLCWKLILCSEDETLHGCNFGLQNEAGLSAADSWLHSKLMPANDDCADDLLVSSPGLAIWRSWVRSQSGVDLSCCLSVIKSMEFDDVNKSLGGANAVLFLLSEQIPIELQKKRLHDLVSLLPSGSSLPLLVLSASCKNEPDPSNISTILELDNIDKSRVTMSYITFLKDVEMKDGYFSDEHLRDGLGWLARESPPQIVVTRTKTREWVLSHLNTTMEFLEQMDTHRVSPNQCISAFNEALDRSMKEIAATAIANPTGWPCPEIELLDESSYEYKSTTWYLPSLGWSSGPRIEALLSALNDSKLPLFEYDLSWLSTGLHTRDDIGKQKSRLENCLINYLTETSHMMGLTLARNEAGIVLQNCTSLELHNTAYYITPKWVPIYRRLFNWRLMQLNTEEVSSTYLLKQHYTTAPSLEVPTLPPYQFQPSFDELVEVGFWDTGLVSNDMEHEDVQPRSPLASNGADVPISIGNIVSVENKETSPQDSMLTSYAGEGNPVVHTVEARKSRETDRLSELLEKCNIVQNLIDDKLSIYF